jgi:hypothetical protein
MRCVVEANKSLLRLLEGECRGTARIHATRPRSMPDVDLLSRLPARVETGAHLGSHTYSSNNNPIEFDGSPRGPQVPRPPYPLPGHDPDLVTAEQDHAHFLLAGLLAGMMKPLPSEQGYAHAQAIPMPPAPVSALVPDRDSMQPEPPLPRPRPIPTSELPFKEQSDFDALLRAGVEESRKIADALRITREDFLDALDKAKDDAKPEVPMTTTEKEEAAIAADARFWTIAAIFGLSLLCVISLLLFSIPTWGVGLLNESTLLNAPFCAFIAVEVAMIFFARQLK